MDGVAVFYKYYWATWLVCGRDAHGEHAGAVAGGAWDESLWAATDHLGNVRELLDNSEAIVEHRDYTSFGTLDAAYNALGNPIGVVSFKSEIGFTGKFFDSATGLQYNNARWYDPSTGKFINKDPAHDGSNWYAYAGNDPINFVDPTGLSQAGHPLSNLSLNAYAGGYSGGVVGARPQDVFNINPNNIFGPTLSGKTTNSISTASLINSFSGPIYTPTAKDLTNYGPVAQTFNPLGTSTSTFRPSKVNIHDLLPTGPTLLDQVTSVVYAAAGGLKTSGKAFVNAGASTAVSFGTLGSKQYDGPFSVTPQDIGYTAANIGFRTAFEIGTGLLTGGLSQLSRAGSATRAVANTALVYDTAGNALSAGRGLVDAYNHGPTLGNAVQIVGGGLGLGGNIATGGRALQDLASDATRVRVSFDPATVSASGLGGVKVSLAPKTERLFDLPAFQRGRSVELDPRVLPEGRGGLPFNSPVIDSPPGISVTSINLAAPGYQKGNALINRIYAKAAMLPSYPGPRELRIAIPDDVPISPHQQRAFEAARRGLQSDFGVGLKVIPIN